MAFKYYAVKKGKVPGIYFNWPDCSDAVKGFMGAQYKGFNDITLAEQYIAGTYISDKAVNNVDDFPTEYDYIVYTDGSCLKNPDGPGGYAAVIIDMKNKQETVVKGNAPSTTNNRMELFAVIESLKAIADNSKILIRTDSKYIEQAINDKWLNNWVKAGWKRKKNKPVLNVELWQEIYSHLLTKNIKFEWVRGHNNNKYNEICDKLAVEQSRLVI